MRVLIELDSSNYIFRTPMEPSFFVGFFFLFPDLPKYFQLKASLKLEIIKMMALYRQISSSSPLTELLGIKNDKE